MRLARAIVLAALLSGLGSRPGRAQVTVEGFLGSAVSLPTLLTIRQAGFEDLRFTAHYSTRPYSGETSWYYQAQIGLWKGRSAWILGFLHHKLYLDDPPPDVQRFELTHGFNIIYLARAWRHDKMVYSVGAGPVVTSPQVTVRGQSASGARWFPGRGYHLSGASLQAAVSRRIPLTDWLFLGVEGKVTGSFARIPIVDGHADVPNVAFHLHSGLGFRL